MAPQRSADPLLMSGTLRTHMAKTLLSWSSGKDSAFMLALLRADPALEVVGLLTTFTEKFDRVAMHAVRSSIVRNQAAAVGLPIWPIYIPSSCTDEQYRRLF